MHSFVVHLKAASRVGHVKVAVRADGILAIELVLVRGSKGDARLLGVRRWR